ncbi:uncharacterized protein LOC144575593 [Carex rostrata]
MMAAVSVTSLKFLHLPFSTSISSRQLPYHHLPLKSQINNGNLLVCKANTENYNVEMVLDEDDPADLYVDYFEREVAKSGLAQEWRRRRFHETPKEERKRKSRDQARNRARDRRRASGKPRVFKRKYDDDYDYDDDDDNPDEAFLGTALDNLLDPEYQEGSLDLLEIDVPDVAWQPDGSGIFPVNN